MESTGVRWCLLSPLDLLCGKSLVGIRRLCWNMLNSGGLRWTPPGQNMQIWPLSHQHNLGFKSSGIRWNPLESAGIWQNMWGSVQSSTWATHGNQQKPGNWEIRKPMSCFPETSQNDELRKPQKPQESETYGNWLTTAIVIIEIEVSFWVSGFPSFWKPMKTSENPEIFLPNC